MSLTIHIPFEFKATHYLPVRPDPHGHTFRLVLSIQGPLDENDGFIIDMHKVREIVSPVIEELQGATLNAHPPIKDNDKLASTYPTCETLVHFFAKTFKPKIDAIKPDAHLSRAEVHIVNDGVEGSSEEWGFASLDL